MTFRLRTRLAGLEKAFPRPCPACAGRPPVDLVVFRYKGVLQTGRGQPLAESDLLPCPVCGKGGVRGSSKVVEGVNPALILGVKPIHSVDPALI